MTTPRPKPPYPPSNDAVRFNWKDTHFVVSTPGLTTKIPIAGATIQTVDNTGKRVTITRTLMLGGLLAGGLKKKTGDVTVVVAGADGTTAIAKAKAKHAADVIAWALAFNAWSEANPVT